MGFLSILFGKKPVANGRKILVVDDNDVDRKLVENTLLKAGYSVVTASNGVEGYQIAIAEFPELIVMDCEMPQMTGIEMCKKIKENEQFSEIPVVFLTSLDTPNNVLDCFEVDAENFLTKPLQPKLLLNEIARSLLINK